MASSVIDLARVGLAAGALELLLRAMNIDRGWWLAVLVVAVAYVGGALSFLPGGIGANEASVVGVLVGLGRCRAGRRGGALLERVLLTGVPSAIGVMAYVAIHRRLHIGSLVASPSAGRGPARSARPPHVRRRLTLSVRLAGPGGGAGSAAADPATLPLCSVSAPRRHLRPAQIDPHRRAAWRRS